MLDKETYKQWTSAFNEGSTYEGSWEKGADIRFVGPNEDGTVSGMISRIDDSRPFEFISIQHLGEIMNGKEDTTSDRVKEWRAGRENYTFKDLGNGKTEVIVDVDTIAEFKEMMDGMWPKALKALKKIAER